jgi:hypothetical protein
MYVRQSRMLRECVSDKSLSLSSEIVCATLATCLCIHFATRGRIARIGVSFSAQRHGDAQQRTFVGGRGHYGLAFEMPHSMQDR